MNQYISLLQVAKKAKWWYCNHTIILSYWGASQKFLKRFFFPHPKHKSLDGAPTGAPRKRFEPGCSTGGFWTWEDSFKMCTPFVWGKNTDIFEGILFTWKKSVLKVWRVRLSCWNFGKKTSFVSIGTIIEQAFDDHERTWSLTFYVNHWHCKEGITLRTKLTRKKYGSYATIVLLSNSFFFKWP